MVQDENIQGNSSHSDSSEEQPNLLKYKLFRLAIASLVVLLLLAVLQWGLHKLKDKGQKKVSEWTQSPPIKSLQDDDIEEVVTDEDTTDQSEDKWWVTYTKFNPTTGETYVGRTSGYGTPESLVKKRDYAHKYNAFGFLSAIVDKYSHSYNAIRGREQQKIDYFGGAKSDRLRDGKPSKCANKIRAVARNNPAGKRYHWASSTAFGEVFNYTGK